MTHSSQNSSNESVWNERISFLNGAWIPHHQMNVGVDDVGFRQGVVAVERLRTYCGAPFETEKHFKRWKHTTTELALSELPSLDELHRLLMELLENNRSLVGDADDVGITIFASPGSDGGSKPTLGLHLNPLDSERNQIRREQGQPVVIVDVRQPAPECWPRTIKVRSRLHYYRADLLARRFSLGAIGILTDGDGSVTESSIANLAIVEAGKIISPPKDRILDGVTQSVIEGIAVEYGIDWSYEPISPKRFADAQEVLLMGTDTGIWFASEVDGCSVSGSGPGRTYLQLRKGFDLQCKRAPEFP